MLRDVEIGEWVYTIKLGWAKVIAIDTSTNYPVRVSIKDGDEWCYKFNGKINTTDVNPSAWTYNPFNKCDEPPCEFEEGEVIAVRSSVVDVWVYKRFYKKGLSRFLTVNDFSSNENVIHDSWYYARKLNDKELGNL